MRKRTKHLLSGIALAAGAVGTVGAILMKKNSTGKERRRGDRSPVKDVWARPGMQVVFRAELMPGRDSSERVFRVTEFLPSGRVLLDGVAGEHNEKEFEAIRR
jgi:hypothetical protein